jgi:putative transposase
MRTAYRCRAYPDPAQQAVLNRTFGCVRVVWNQTLAARQQQYVTDRTATSYAQTDRALTVMKKDPAFAFLNEVAAVPLQQTLRHQHKAFTAFFAKRARYPRFKSRHARQCAHYTRAAFTMRARPGGAEPFHPDVAMPVLRHPARPGRQCREEHPGRWSSGDSLRS